MALLVVGCQYNENLGMNMSGLLPYAIVLHLAFAVWMLSNPSIFQTSTLSLSEVDQATSVTGVIDSNDKTGQRIRQKHTFPLFLVLLIVAGVRDRVICVVVVVVHNGRCLPADDRVKPCWQTGEGGYGQGVDVPCVWGIPVWRRPRQTVSVGASSSYTVHVRIPSLCFPPGFLLMCWAVCSAIQNKELRGLSSYNILKNPRFAHAFAISASFAEKYGNVPRLCFRACRSP
jgi:hypothetical protein